MLKGKRPYSGEGELALPRDPRILLIRHDRIGDAIVSTPIVSLIRERFPKATIGLLLGRKNRAAASLVGGVDMVHSLDGRPSGYLSIASELRRCRYDLVINLLAKDSASGALLTVLSGAGYRIGFQGEATTIYDRAIAQPDEPMHIVSRTSLLLAPLGIMPIGPEPRRSAERLVISLPLDAQITGLRFWESITRIRNSPRVVVNISASSPSKLWPDERTTALLDLLRSEGATVAAASAPADRDRLDTIVTHGGHAALPVTSSLAEFAALLAPADLVITPDTSIVHIAAALRRPVVMITAGSAADSWGPWGVPSRIVRGDGDSIASVDVASVAEAYSSLRLATDRATGASPLI
jgi:heptosyltransferase-3